MTHRNVWIQLLVMIAVLAALSCASVPKEVVELSYTMGKDLQELHRSYRALIATHFDGLRAQSTDFLESRWRPVYLRKFIEKGKLLELAKNNDPDKVLEGVTLWANVAMAEIDAKRHTLIDPINKQERDLLDAVDASFAQVELANATVTAHLNSLRKVQEVQDEVLKTLKIKDLRDEINQGLVKASDLAAQGIKDLAQAEGLAKRP